MDPRRLVLTTLVAALVAAATGAGAEDAPPFPHEAGLPLARWQTFMDLTHVPGLAVAIVADTGVVAVATLGDRDVEAHRPVTPRTRFYIASCTKTFVATALWSMAGDGLVDLDAPVRRVMPTFRLADPGLTDSLTLRDLLAHRQGLASSPIQFATANTGLMSDTLFDRLLARVRPLRRFRYSNLHYLVAGRAIAARTGEPWQQVLAERVLVPAGLTRATTSARVLYGDPDTAFPYAWSHGRFERAALKTDRTMHAAGGMGMSLEDAARWLRIQLGLGAIDGRRVFPEAMIRGMRESAVAIEDRHPLRADQRRTGWSAGWELRDLGGEPMLTHSGTYRGAAAHFSVLPQRRLAVAVFANGDSPLLTEWIAAEAYDWAMGKDSPDVRERARALMARMTPPPPDTSRGALTSRPAAYAGRYRHPDWGAIDVSPRPGGLALRWGDLSTPILLTGRDTFDADGTPGHFERDGRGRPRTLWLTISAPDSVGFTRP